MPIRLAVFLVALIVGGELLLASFYPSLRTSMVILTIIEVFIAIFLIARWGRSNYLLSDKDFCEQCRHTVSKD